MVESFAAVRRGQALSALIAFVLVVLAGCATSPSGNHGVEARKGDRPEWRPGDRWVYRVNGAERGTKTVEVLATRDVNGSQYYILKTPESELLSYWTVDLGWAFAVGGRDSTVQARTEPPIPWFRWPLVVGQQWSHHGIYEDRSGKRDANEDFMVVTAEDVEVPAGRFRAFKIVRQGQSADSDQYWYAPEVRSYIKWILTRGEQRIEEELVEYKPVERLIPTSSKTTSIPK